MSAVATLAAPADAPRKRDAWWQKILKDRVAVFALIVLGAIVLAALLAPWIAPYDPRASTRNMMQPPFWAERGSMKFILGTDEQGRDILSRLLYGARLSLLIGIFCATVGSVVGSLFGLLAAYSPRLDGPIMRVVDAGLAIPGILIALGIVSVLGQGLVAVMVGMAVSSLPDCARVARSVGVGVMRQDYVEASRALGISSAGIFLRCLVRNSAASLLVFFSMRFGQFILGAAALSFLGLGVQPPTAELGVMAAQGRGYLMYAPHIATIPAALIFIMVLATNVIGDAVRDALDPRMQ